MAGDGGGGGGLETVVSVAEVDAVVRYIRRVASVMLEDDEEASPELQTALNSPQYLEMIRKFLGDTQTKSLLIQRCATKGKVHYIKVCMT